MANQLTLVIGESLRMLPAKPLMRFALTFVCVSAAPLIFAALKPGHGPDVFPKVLLWGLFVAATSTVLTAFVNYTSKSQSRVVRAIPVMMALSTMIVCFIINRSEETTADFTVIGSLFTIAIATGVQLSATERHTKKHRAAGPTRLTKHRDYSDSEYRTDD